MSRSQLLSCNADGSDVVYLDGLADIQSLHLIHGQNGSQAATWDLYADANFNHRALTAGRRIYATKGAGFCWSGYLSDPSSRTVPWNCAAVGIAAEGGNFPAYAPTTGNALKPNEVVDEAITLGLTSWSRGMSLPGVSEGVDASGVSSINDALSTIATANGDIWKVTTGEPGVPGVLTMVTQPTIPSWIVYATGAAGGRTLDTFVSLYLVTYLDETTRAQTTIIVGGASKYGTFPDSLDLTDQSYISATTARGLANAQLALNSPRAPYTGTFNVIHGQVLTTGGVAPDLLSLGGADLYLIQQLNPDSAGELDLTIPTQLLMSSIDVDVDADAAELTPWTSTDDS